MDLFTQVTDLFYDLRIIYRVGFAFLTSAILVIVLGSPFIKLLKKIVQPIRDDGPNHLQKQGTPTMGGILIIFSFIVTTLIWSNLNTIILVILLGTFLFALIGFIDDLLKIVRFNSKGLSGKLRLLLEFIIAIGAMYFLISEYPAEIADKVFFPFINSFYIYVGGVGIFAFTAFVMVGTANSVNLTDGLDSLASMISFTLLSALLIVGFLIINPVYYATFNLDSLFYFTKIREIMVLIAALAGAILGFLWHNSYPAKIFMGDIGSLGIGGAIGLIVVALKQEIFLLVAGIFIVLESLSVIIQVYWYKYTKERFFLMAPLHHHYEKKGIAETVIVKRIWIFTIFTSLIAILMLDIF